MIKLTDAGAIVLPASPAFYHHPETIEDIADSVVARILNLLEIDQNIISQWKVKV